MMSQHTQQVKENLQNTSQWMRVLYMIIFWFILYFSMMIIGTLIFVQVLFTLLSGKENKNIRNFSTGLITFIKQTLSFLTYIDNRMPFPFASWGEVSKSKPLAEESSSNGDENVDEHEAIVADSDPAPSKGKTK